MELKRYQRRVVHEVRAYLNALEAQLEAGNLRHAGEDAWRDCRVPGRYNSRQNGLGNDLPTFCIKVPTGGGKTLLATEILGEMYRTVLKARRGAGLVLWVVPSDQIYKDTLRALRDRTHPYRESLEFCLSRRIEVWEKHEIARLTPGQLATNLNVLVVKLQGTNKQDRESLKFFRDSGGNIMAHFPPEDEPEQHRELKAAIPNLDMLAEDEETSTYLVKTSVGNLVRKCQPAVILDEGHKATSDLARQTIEGFNASLVVELSATPKREANVLVRVSGQELLDEEMIKLPLNVQNSNQKSWKSVLTDVRDWRNTLAETAQQHRQATGRHIRPIVLVQVERTGKDQRDSQFIHSEDVREYLMQRLGVEEHRIAVKTSQKDDIEGTDLLHPECSTEWIITKAALQEGWDCPFAYVLVSLNNTKSKTSMTQLVGRVLRQPYQQRSECDDLNQCYVYCLKQSAATVVKEVKQALEKEGYEGTAAAVHDTSTGRPDQSERVARIKPEHKRHYQRPFEGRIFIPRFCVRNGDGIEALDYYRHLISNVDVSKFDFELVDWDFTTELARAAEHFYQITLGEEATHREAEIEILEGDAQVKLWLVSTLGFDWLSAKQTQTVVEDVYTRLPGVHGKLALIKGLLQEKIGGFIESETDRMTEAVFKRLHDRNKLLFHLECVAGRFEIPQEVSVRVTKKLRRDNDEEVERSLFDYVPNDINEYERSIALYLDEHPEVLWWYRNLVGPANFAIQGYRRNRIYPDFLIQRGDAQQQLPIASVLVLESKGKHLKGNEDTNYKRDVARIYEELGHEVSWQKLGEGFENHRFRFQVLDEGEYASHDWRDRLNEVLAE